MDNYVEEFKLKDKTDKEKEIELFINILKSKKELDESLRNFEYAEEELIDYYTYQIKATRAKFDYLVRLAKEQGLELNMLKQIQIKTEKII